MAIVHIINVRQREHACACQALLQDRLHTLGFYLSGYVSLPWGATTLGLRRGQCLGVKNKKGSPMSASLHLNLLGGSQVKSNGLHPQLLYILDVTCHFQLSFFLY